MLNKHPKVVSWFKLFLFYLQISGIDKENEFETANRVWGMLG